MIRSVQYFIFMLATAAFSPVAIAANYDVGPGAAYATIQAGIDAALTAGGTNTVRVQAGTYNENISSLDVLVTGKSLELSGGWDATYTTQNTDPAVTIIDGGSTGRALNISTLGGTFIMQYFTVTNGGSVALGAGMNLQANGNTNVTLSTIIFSNNHAITGAGSAIGGGLLVSVSASSTLFMIANEFNGNSTTGDTFAAGSGLDITCQNTATIEIIYTIITNNTATSNAGEANAAGLSVFQADACDGIIERNAIFNNNTTGTSGTSAGPGAQFIQRFDANSSLNATGNIFFNNVDDKNVARSQVVVFASNTGSAAFSDSIVAGGNRGGLYVSADAAATITLTNNTIADNTGGEGIFFIRSGTFKFYNNIIQGNQTDTPVMQGGATPIMGSNLIGIDPFFRDRSTGNYRLTSSSAAIDAGDAAQCGLYDMFGQARVVDGNGDTVAICDIGADEYDPDPLNGAPDTPILLTPADGATGIDGASVTFTWSPVIDPDGDTVTYNQYLCTSADFSGCSASPPSPALMAFGAGGAGLMLFAFTGSGRRRIRYGTIFVLVSFALLSACGSSGSSGGGGIPAGGTTSESYTATGLTPGTTYYWRVVASDGNGNTSVSTTWSFTTL